MTTRLAEHCQTRMWGSGPGYCKWCGQALLGLQLNRNALTCSNACRQAAWRAAHRPSQIKSPARLLDGGA